MNAYISDSTGDLYCEKHAPSDSYQVQEVEDWDCCVICKKVFNEK